MLNSVTSKNTVCCDADAPQQSLISRRFWSLHRKASYNVKPVAPSASCELQRRHGPRTGADHVVRQDAAGQDLNLDVPLRLRPRSHRPDSDEAQHGGKATLGRFFDDDRCREYRPGLTSDMKSNHRSQLAAIGQSIAVCIQCANGFGQHINVLRDHQISAILKVR